MRSSALCIWRCPARTDMQAEPNLEYSWGSSAFNCRLADVEQEKSALRDFRNSELGRQTPHRRHSQWDTGLASRLVSEAIRRACYTYSGAWIAGTRAVPAGDCVDSGRVTSLRERESSSSIRESGWWIQYYQLCLDRCAFFCMSAGTP